MTIFQTIWFMIAVLPFIMFVEGMQKLAKLMGEKNWLWVLPYVLVVVLSILVLILISFGYR